MIPYKARYQSKDLGAGGATIFSQLKDNYKLQYTYSSF